MSKKNDYEIGKVYGVNRLVSLFHNDNGKLRGKVECILCGRIKIVQPSYLITGKNAACSCRCTMRTADGMSHSRLYKAYQNMKDRCYNPNYHGFYNYGGKGVKVCEEWLCEGGFLRFKEWALKNVYNDIMTLDRINSNGDYSPNNCRWLTRSENTACANREHRQRRKAIKGTYYGIIDGIYYEFEDAAKFSREHNLDAGKLRAYARGCVKNYDGMVFGYVCDLQNSEPQSTIENPEIRSE